MQNQTLVRGRLHWKCRRGMLELDIILGNFFEGHYDQLDDNEKQAFAQLLECEDVELFAWFMREKTPQNPVLRVMVEKIISQ